MPTEGRRRSREYIPVEGRRRHIASICCIFSDFLKYYNIYGVPAYFLRDFLHECCNFSVKQKILQLFFRNVVFFQKNHFFYNIRLSGTGENG